MNNNELMKDKMNELKSREIILKKELADIWKKRNELSSFINRCAIFDESVIYYITVLLSYKENKAFVPFIYALALNNENGGVKCNLHSGPDGWDTKLWSAEPFNEGPTSCISFSLVSPDGDMGFPGKVEATVTYRIRPDNVWSVEYEAKTDAPTVINLTHHSYWNLAGESSGTVLGQELQIFADEYTEVASSLIPVKNAPVAGTPFDFTTMKKIGSALSSASANEQLGFGSGWYDHNFVLRASSGAMKPACRLRDPVSGRTLEISTTEPGMQVYGAQGMSASLPAKAPGKALCQYAGIAIETQHFPDSPNRPDFPSTVLRPGETFHSVTEYRFGVEK